MEEEEGRRAGFYFRAEGAADGSGLAGTMPLSSSTTPNYSYSKWGGAKIRGVSGGCPQTAPQGGRANEGPLNQVSLSSSTLEVIKSEAYSFQKINSILGVAGIQGPKKTR